MNMRVLTQTQWEKIAGGLSRLNKKKEKKSNILADNIYLIYGVITLLLAFYIPHRILAVELNKSIINKKRDIFLLAASIVLFTGPISYLIIDSFFGYGIQEFLHLFYDSYIFYRKFLPVLIGLLFLASVYLYFWQNFQPAKYYLMWFSIWVLAVSIQEFSELKWLIEAAREASISFPYFIFLMLFFLVEGFIVPALIIRGNILLLRDDGFRMIYNESNTKEYLPKDELSQKEFLPTFLLCFFFGSLGIHRFYVGKIGTGVLMILTIGGLGLWIIIDLIMILIGSFRDIDGHIVKYNSGNKVTTSNNKIGIAAEIEQLASLKEKGILSEEEFSQKKKELLDL